MKKTVSLICTLVLLLCSIASLSAGAVEIGAQLVENGGFEEDLVGYWNPATAGYRMEDGDNHYLSLVIDGANVYQDVYDTDGNASYRISFKYKATVDYATWVYANNMVFADGTLSTAEQAYTAADGWNSYLWGNSAAELYLKKTYDAKDSDGNDNTPVWETVSCTFYTHPGANVIRVGIRGATGNFDNLFGIDDIKVERIEDNFLRNASFENVYQTSGNLFRWYNTSGCTLSTDAIDGKYSLAAVNSTKIQNNWSAPCINPTTQEPLYRYWECSYWVKIKEMSGTQGTTMLNLEFANKSNTKVGATLTMSSEVLTVVDKWIKVSHYFRLPDNTVGGNFNIHAPNIQKYQIDNMVLRPVTDPVLLLSDSRCHRKVTYDSQAADTYTTVAGPFIEAGKTVNAVLYDPASGKTDITSGTVICALYVKKGTTIRLVDFAAGTGAASVTIPDTALEEGESYETRAYVWNSLGGLKPLVEVTEA